jgi:hypothetical protein
MTSLEIAVFQLDVPLTARADSAKVVVYDYGADVLGSRNVKVPR